MFNGKHIHFIGIGGISMSGIAELVHNEGALVTGSDMQEGNTINMLRNLGINIFIGENKDLVNDADIVVYTAAIKEDNEELVRAKELNKEIYERAEFLGRITKNYHNVICISGTHGKSTTTGMISNIFLEEELNPTIQIGAILPKINSNSYIGDKFYFIMESCEYVDSFLHFHPTSAIILNIDNDHLDYFKTLDNIKLSFTKFTNLLPNNGLLVINNDDVNTTSINYNKNCHLITYGINNNSIVMAKNITYDNYGYPEFDVYYNNELYTHIKLHVFGAHNIYNALASTSISIFYNIDKKSIIKGLSEYTGVERRFQLLGKFNNALVYDDYAHHPTEIKATLNSVKSVNCNQNWVVFQSHTYSRTKEHLHEFASILKCFDNIIIAPIYPAREENIYNIKETDLVNLIKPNNENVIYIDSFSKIVDYLKEHVKENDLVLTMGAGPVNKVALDLIENKN